ncbi:MAG TPA: 50S ribosomal protein L4 [Gemmatimonadaceae bacterium]|nr:50S ribosomal protein L4 [Gemmatimonadaceae bacterium]
MAETTTFQAAAYTAQGAERESVTLPAALFDGTVNMPVMHQAVKAYLANQRQGNASTKIRKYVSGGNQKPWKQKGTGRARQGSIRAPQWVGGGTVFGPIPRSYAQYVPRQVRQLARKSAFNARARESSIFIIDALSYEAPKTKQLVDLISRLGVADKKVLILTEGVKANVFLSGRNLPLVHVMPYADVSTYHILWSDVVLIESGALGSQLEPVEDEARDEGRGTRGAKSARKAASKAGAKKAATRGAGVAKKAAKKRPAAKKSAAKKSASKSTKKKGK